MHDLLAYFRLIPVPTAPIKLAYVTVTDPQLFLDSCQRMHERGDPLGETLLRDYKSAIEGLAG